MSANKKRKLLVFGITAVTLILAFGISGCKKSDDAKVIIELEAGDTMNKDSSPVVLEFKGVDKGNDYETARAISAESKKDEMTMPKGKYQVRVVPSINKDASIEVLDDKNDILEVDLSKVDDSGKKLSVKLKNVPKEKITKADYEKIIKNVKEASKHGDDTISKDKCEAVLKVIETNMKNSPNLGKKDAEDKDKTEGKVSESENKTAEAKDESAKYEGDSSEATSTGTTSSAKTPSKKEAGGKTWIPEKGHYENKTTTTYELKEVTKRGYYDEQFTKYKYTCRDGFTSFDLDEIEEHCIEVLRNCDNISGICEGGGYVYEPYYEKVWVDEPYTTYEEVPVTKTSKVWVVDVPGHYE